MIDDNFVQLISGYIVFFLLLYLINKTTIGHIVLYYGLILLIAGLILINSNYFVELLERLTNSNE